MASSEAIDVDIVDSLLTRSHLLVADFCLDFSFVLLAEFNLKAVVYLSDDCRGWVGGE
jgi:hypothetical protein